MNLLNPRKKSPKKNINPQSTQGRLALARYARRQMSDKDLDIRRTLAVMSTSTLVGAGMNDVSNCWQNRLQALKRYRPGIRFWELIAVAFPSEEATIAKQAMNAETGNKCKFSRDLDKFAAEWVLKGDVDQLSENLRATTELVWKSLGGFPLVEEEIDLKHALASINSLEFDIASTKPSEEVKGRFASAFKESLKGFRERAANSSSKEL